MKKLIPTFEGFLFEFYELPKSLKVKVKNSGKLKYKDKDIKSLIDKFAKEEIENINKENYSSTIKNNSIKAINNTAEIIKDTHKKLQYAVNQLGIDFEIKLTTVEASYTKNIYLIIDLNDLIEKYKNEYTEFENILMKKSFANPSDFGIKVLANLVKTILPNHTLMTGKEGMNKIAVQLI